MVGRAAGKPGLGMTSRFAHAAGDTGILAYSGIPVWFVLLVRHLGASVG